MAFKLFLTWALCASLASSLTPSLLFISWPSSHSEYSILKGCFLLTVSTFYLFILAGSSERCEGFSGCGLRAQQSWHRGSAVPRHVGSSCTRGWTCVPCTGQWILSGAFSSWYPNTTNSFLLSLTPTHLSKLSLFWSFVVCGEWIATAQENGRAVKLFCMIPLEYMCHYIFVKTHTICSDVTYNMKNIINTTVCHIWKWLTVSPEFSSQKTSFLILYLYKMIFTKLIVIIISWCM